GWWAGDFCCVMLEGWRGISRPPCPWSPLQGGRRPITASPPRHDGAGQSGHRTGRAAAAHGRLVDRGCLGARTAPRSNRGAGRGHVYQRHRLVAIQPAPRSRKKSGIIRDVSYDRYIAWRRLTHNGERSREQMSAQDQAEYDALGIQESVLLEGSFEEAKLAY